MTDTTTSLLLAAMLAVLALAVFLGALVVRRWLARLGADLRRADARLVARAPLIAEQMGAQRTRLSEAHAAAERALWSLASFDERLDTTRLALAERRVALHRQRARLVAARFAFERTKRLVRMLITTIELRRTILG